ncbi:type II toxin-antitoxin system HicB family antitoxin [Micromonospora sp. NPDC050686]|uniref:type II toxin-antitoxin system HicB family antitoxin n=1 Tax=Micromonospora sp. NPDC050686 TaxID=3154631 RepID=UPI0033E88C06
MTFTAECVRSGGWWAITVPEIKGVFSQARHLDEVEAMAREAIALMLDVDPHTFDVDLHRDLPQEPAGN